MAGTLTVAAADIGGAITRYTLTWASDASGAVTGTFDVSRGRMVQVRQIPDGGGTQPTDLYDMTIVDANSIDVLVGTGANISNAAASYFQPTLTGGYPPFLEAGTLTLAISNAGNAKGGQSVLYMVAADVTQANVAAVTGVLTPGNAVQLVDANGTLEDAGLALGSGAALNLIAGFAKHALVAGAAAGDVTVTGIKMTDTLNMVLQFIGTGVTITPPGVVDLTGEFTISGAGKINNTGGTSSSGDKLLVLWTATT